MCKDPISKYITLTGTQHLFWGKQFNPQQEALLIKDKLDFKSKTVMRDQKRTLYIDKRVNQEDTRIINTYTPNI